MTNPTEELNGVLLEGHSRSTAEAETPPSQGSADLGSGELYARGQPFKSREQGRTMRFTSSQPTQHVKILPQRGRGSGQRLMTWTGNISATQAPRIIEGPNAI